MHALESFESMLKKVRKAITLGKGADIFEETLHKGEKRVENNSHQAKFGESKTKQISSKPYQSQRRKRHLFTLDNHSLVALLATTP